MPSTVDNGTNVAYRLTGEGRIMVFITQSLGFASAEWWPLQDQLSGHARVLTWDRPGYGKSRPPLSPRTVSNIAAEGLELLSRLAPDGPLVLVGHSQGGLYTNSIARLVGSRVLAVVLLDPAHPDNSRFRRELPPKLFRASGSDLSVRLRMARNMARFRLIGLLKPLMRKQPPFLYCAQHPPRLFARCGGISAVPRPIRLRWPSMRSSSTGSRRPRSRPSDPSRRYQSLYSCTTPRR